VRASQLVGEIGGAGRDAVMKKRRSAPETLLSNALSHDAATASFTKHGAAAVGENANGAQHGKRGEVIAAVGPSVHLRYGSGCRCLSRSPVGSLHVVSS
jgi:hypothetical protein